MSSAPLVRWDELPTYQPPAHYGTTNRRLLDEQQSGGRVSVVHGTLATDGGAECHHHQVSAQWTHILAGSCLVLLDDEKYRLAAGDSVFIEPGVRHEVVVTSTEELRLINVYQPPLQPADIYPRR